MTINEEIKKANNLHNIKHGSWKNSSVSGPSVSHDERKALVKSALEQQAPPFDRECSDDKIVNLPERHFIEDELNTLEEWVKKAEPWSVEKTHYMTLIASIACTETLPLEHRTRASALIRSNVDDPIVPTSAK